MPSGAAVIRYDGKRGTVWRIKYADATGRQVMETVGAERDGVTRRQAEAELRERLVRVERKGYRRPRALTFGEYAQTWLEEGQRSQGWKPARSPCTATPSTAISRPLSASVGWTRCGRVTSRRSCATA